MSDEIITVKAKSKCPLLSAGLLNGVTTIDTDSIGYYMVYCAKTACKWWVPDDPVDLTSNEFGGRCLMENLTNNLSTMSTHYVHWHRQHEHNVSHVCSSTSTDCGNVYIASSRIPPYATILAQEYATNEDRDGNNRVYGYDFGILPTNDKPMMLNSMENTPNWNVQSVQVSWSDLMKWFTGQGPEPVTTKELALLCVYEFLQTKDLDTNGKIFGDDFGIIEDDNKPDCLIEWETTMITLSASAGYSGKKWVAPLILIEWEKFYNWKFNSGQDPFIEYNYCQLLIQEYETHNDLDGNGYRYGLDFGFTESTKPQVFIDYEKNKDISVSVLISYTDLYNWRFNSGTDPLISVWTV